MKNLFHLLPGCFLVLSLTSSAQDIPTRVEQMKTAYAASGSIVALDSQTLVIEPNMPGPICALPRSENGKIAWYRYTFPLASITVPLSSIDESLMTEDRVFTDPSAPQTYKPGAMGDTIMVVVVSTPGRKFRAQIYDRERLAGLGPGPHSSSEYGQIEDQVEAFGLTFSDANAARSFVAALRNAVMLARAQASAR